MLMLVGKTSNLFTVIQMISLRLVKYFFMAVVIVFFELAAFEIMNFQLGLHYLVAVTLSFVFATLLNWHFSRVFVFGKGSNRVVDEVILIFLGSVIGLILQITTTVVCVEYLNSQSILGKALSMGVTFFWNYWFRVRYVFVSNQEI